MTSAMHPRFHERLVVVSGVLHHRHEGRVHAYTAYAREMALWADLFAEVRIAAPCVDGPPPDDCAPIDRDNVVVLPQRMLGGTTWRAKLAQLVRLPQMAWELTRAMRSGDAVHVRCPANLGGLAVALAPLVSSRLVAKYAGQWTGFTGEAASYRVQRWLLASRWWRGPVTVYGEWSGQPPQVVPFFTSVMSTEHVAQARAVAERRRFGEGPLRVLYVGRLSPLKRVDAVLDGVAGARRAGLDVVCTIVGDGPARDSLARQAATIGLGDAARFTGAVAYDDVLAEYARADVLVLISESEGWPKGVAEAMAFGLVCIGANHGYVAQMLAEGRGRTLGTGDAAALTRELLQLAATPGECAAMSARAAAWAQRFTREALRAAIGDLLQGWWVERPRTRQRSGVDATLAREGP